MDQHMADLFDRLEKRLDKVEDKVEDKFEGIQKALLEISTSLTRVETSHKIQDIAHQKTTAQLDTVDSRLDTYNSSLQEHMRRTDLLEDKLDTLEQKKVDPLHAAFTQEQAAKVFIEQRKEKFYKNVKLIGAVAAAIVSLITLYKIFS